MLKLSVLSMEVKAKPIPPPLPPPVPQLSTPIKENTSSEHLSSPQEEVSNTCLRLWKYLVGDNMESYVISIYHQVKPIIQNGPKCGLVALCMASQLLSQVITVEKAFNRAKILGFTNEGEMFSAENMGHLVKDLLCCQVDTVVNVKKHQDAILRHLLHGLPLLIPYDADGNHEPCCKKGHTAHWAIITGFCIVLNGIDCKVKFIGIQDPKHKQLYHWRDKVLPVNISDNMQIYVYARQGKSSKLELWNFDYLCASNANLRELGAKHIANNFVLPEKGIFNELANHALLLH